MVMASLFFLFLSVSTDLFSSIVLTCQYAKMLKQDDSTIEYKTFAGKRFSIEVTIESDQGNVSLQAQDFIPRTCRILSQGKSTSIHMINGAVASKVQHTYDVVAQEEGVVTLGPVQLGSLRSNSCIIHVEEAGELDDDDEEEEDRGHEEVRERPVFFGRLEVENSQAYVSEPFVVKRKIYHRGTIRNSQVQELHSPDCIIKKIQGAQEFDEEYKGKVYRVFQEKYVAIAKKAGKIVFPAQQFLYEYASSHSRRSVNHFGFFFGLSPFEVEQDQGIIPGATCEIKELPALASHVDAIGSFTAYQLDAATKTVKNHQTCEVALTLKGFTHFDDIPTPKLQLPQGCNTFSASTRMIKTMTPDDQQEVKEFSFVIQPTLGGTLQIPAQTFTFFNPHTKKVETLKTDSLEIEVTGVAGLALDDKDKEKLDHQDEEKALEVVEDKDDILLEKNVALSKRSKKFPSLPWGIWFFLLVLISLGVTYKEIIRWYRKKKSPSLEQVLLQEIEKALERHELKQAHRQLRKLFSLQLKKPEALVTETLIEQLFTKKELLPSEVALLKEVYVHTITAEKKVVYSSDKIKKIISLLKKLFCLIIFFGSLSLWGVTESIEPKMSTDLLQIGLIALQEKQPCRALFWLDEAIKETSFFAYNSHKIILVAKQRCYHILYPEKSSVAYFFWGVGDFFKTISLLWWQVLFLLVWIFFLLSILQKKRLYFSIVVLLSVGLCMVLSAQFYDSCCCLVRSKTTFYSGPDKTYDVVGQCSNESVCRVLKRHETFYKVKHNNVVAWVDETEIEKA